MTEPLKENIWNVPNLLTFSRIVITFITIYFIFASFHIAFVIVSFVVGMITDILDGQIARRFNLKTEFGRQFDMVADRFLMVGTALAFMIKFSADGIMGRGQLLQIFLIMSREIITCPVAMISVFMTAGIPQARFFGKLTTVMQAVAFPLILLGIFYPVFSFSIYFAIITCIIGFVSGIHYINDMKDLMAKVK